MDYKTVSEAASDFFIEKKSRFIGYISPVTTSEEALAFIQKISKKHWDATHNVYAYILRSENIKRCSDDGEPQGTAGVPVLDVLEKEKLTDVCVVATRYFGGIMLGAGGLVRAYSHTCKIAVDASPVVTMTECGRMIMDVDYNLYGKITYLFPQFDVVVQDTQFTDIVQITFLLPVGKTESFIKKITEVTNGVVKPTQMEIQYHAYEG